MHDNTVEHSKAHYRRVQYFFYPILATFYNFPPFLCRFSTNQDGWSGCVVRVRWAADQDVAEVEEQEGGPGVLVPGDTGDTRTNRFAWRTSSLCTFNKENKKSVC